VSVLTTAATSFTVAGAVVLVLIPVMRMLATRVGFLDRPTGGYKDHASAIAYGGGVTIVLAVIAAVGVAVVRGPQPTVSLVGFLALAAGVAMLGLIDDQHSLEPAIRLAAQAAAAAGAVALGARLELTGVVGLDVVLTLVWIVAVTNALNLIDNMDGLSGGLALTSAGAMAVIGVQASQPLVTVVAAAVVGATVGYLAYNLRPAVIFMGDSGTLFLGFVLAVLATRVEVGPTVPWPAVAAALLVGVLAVNTVSIVVGRVRHGIPVYRATRDHLSYRLVDRGWTKPTAVAALGLTNAAVAMAGVALALEWLAPLVAAALGLVALLPAVAAALAVDAYAPYRDAEDASPPDQPVSP
jgi:UDP-GlcNAc:undecaprenyl-phosphate GlcNAc-1-phosphate transferase